MKADGCIMDKKTNILVIDDDHSTLEILLLILQNAGYEVDIAANGDLTFLQTGKFPDLILLDNNLGKKDGADICRELKNAAETHHIPIILISAMDNIKTIAAEACADDFIAKPFGIQLMLEKIQQALRKYAVE
jgi:DNA-binding response OmpR family regulator